MQVYSYINLIIQLLKTDYKIFKRTVVGKLIDLFIWVVTTVWITVYLLPAFGLERSYGSFVIASVAATSGLFELFASVANLVSDFEGNNITSYYLTLPMPSWLVFLRQMLFFTFNTAVQAVFVLPISKLIFWDFALSQVNVVQYVLIFILSNLFFAAFALWTTSMITNMEKIGSVWMRFVYPLWILGGFQYSWKVLYEFKPWLAYVSLANPMVYIMEGMRAAVLGQEGSLNFWFCLGMLVLFTVLCTLYGIYRIKRRLDFI